jgi:hypothetical protein
VSGRHHVNDLRTEFAAYLAELETAGSTLPGRLLPGSSDDAIVAAQPEGLTFPSELREWFSLHDGVDENRMTAIAGTWKVMDLDEAVARHEGDVAVWLPEGAWNPGWRASLFPFVTRDNAELFIECDPAQTPGVYYFSAWGGDAPVLVADSVTGLVSAWRDALRDGLIEIRNGLHHRTPAADTGDITELIP